VLDGLRQARGDIAVVMDCRPEPPAAAQFRLAEVKSMTVLKFA